MSSFLVQSSNAGYGKTKKQVVGIVEHAVKEKGLLRTATISDGWWRRFIERQPEIALCKGDSTAHIRMDAVNHTVIDGYFNLLKECLDEHSLQDNPAQIYNVDETGMPLDPTPPRVAACKGQKKVRVRSGGKKGQMTVLGCVNVIGQAIPPMVIFDAQKLNQEWTMGEFPGTTYGAKHKRVY